MLPSRLHQRVDALGLDADGKESVALLAADLVAVPGRELRVRVPRHRRAHPASRAVGRARVVGTHADRRTFTASTHGLQGRVRRGTVAPRRGRAWTTSTGSEPAAFAITCIHRCCGRSACHARSRSAPGSTLRSAHSLAGSGCGGPCSIHSVGPRYDVPSDSCPASTAPRSTKCSAHLDRASLDRAVAIAELPDLVRGYEDLKLRRVAQFRSRLAREVAELERARSLDHVTT